MGRIDLNSDLGEGFGPWSMGDDAAMLGIVTSANIACGFHAGDPASIRDTVASASERGVMVGAHVGYRDLAGFGRRALDVSRRDLEAETIYQIGALQAIATATGTEVRYVKPHGALYNTIVHDERQADAVIAAMSAVDSSLALMGPPGSLAMRLAQDAGLPVIREVFADRGYRADGTLVPRTEEGAVIHDRAVIRERVVRLAVEGTLQAVDGTALDLPSDSICVHGDTPGAVEIARVARDALREACVDVRPALER